MISRYSQILQQARAINELLGSSPGHVQKIYSTARYLALQIRIPRRSFYLFLGRGGGFEGLWMGETAPASPLRLRDTWLEWSRRNLTGSLLLHVEVDENDRALRLRLQREGGVQDFYLLWAGRSSYFAFHRQSAAEWFTSWGGAGGQGFHVFDPVGRRQERAISEEAPVLTAIDQLLLQEKAVLDQQRVPRAKLKSLRVKIGKIEGDIEKIRQWSAFQAWLVALDPSELEGKSTVSFQTLQYKFPSGLSPWQKREWLFGHVKRLRLAEAHQEKRLHETRLELERAVKGDEQVESTLRPIRPVWKGRTAKTEQPKVVTEDYEVISFGTYKIGVGKTATGNDQLRKSWASSEDWWVHAAHGTSAHAVIKLAAPGQVSPKQIREAAFLIAKRSGFPQTQIEVVVTLVKNVRGVPGSAGMVTYKKQKTLLCELSEGLKS